MTCDECPFFYHVALPSGIAEKPYKSYDVPHAEPELLNTQRSRQKKNEHDVASLLMEINAKLGNLAQLKKTVDSIEHFIQDLSCKYDTYSRS